MSYSARLVRTANTQIRPVGDYQPGSSLLPNHHCEVRNVKLPKGRGEIGKFRNQTSGVVGFDCEERILLSPGDASGAALFDHPHPKEDFI
jgi:hypothetical protein